jgi:UDP-N-acetylmuramoyl-tripeptide--D-alanyl-D-alanine ligase
VKNSTALYQAYLQHPVVCTDSRNLSAGCLYFALRGARFDGNDFAQAALERGAAWAVVDHPKLRQAPGCLYVPDALQALQELAAHHRSQFHIPILGIGGSNGKTTTKELVSAVLSSHYPCHYTKGNLNNHIGVPLTLLSMPSHTEVAVVELGTNQPGDIRELCRIAAPTHGLITNIGKEHLEGFGSIQGVKKAESELFDFLAKNNGCAFVNIAEKYLEAAAKKVTYRVTYGSHPKKQAGIPVSLLGLSPFVQAGFQADDGREQTLQSQLPGRHNFQNIATAIALGVYFRVPAEKIVQALERYKPANNRSQVITKNTTTLFLDAYNANPSSMEAALNTLRDMPAKRKMALLGDMLELGADAKKEHLAILKKAATLHLHNLVVVGPLFKDTPYLQYGARHFDTAEAAGDWFRGLSIPDTAVLIKGSRGMQMETIAADFLGTEHP